MSYQPELFLRNFFSFLSDMYPEPVSPRNGDSVFHKTNKRITPYEWFRQSRRYFPEDDDAFFECGLCSAYYLYSIQCNSDAYRKFSVQSILWKFGTLFYYKLYSDEYPSNAEFAMLLDVDTKTFNRMEREYMEFFNYKVHLPRDVYLGFYKYILESGEE